jgi:hypothetical protein
VEKIHNMVAKCIEVLDPTVKIKFCEITAGVSLLQEREILLPDWEGNQLCHLLMTALHEIAHLWYSASGSRAHLSEEELEALRWIEEAYVDYHFCKNFPEFRFDFREKYLRYQEEYEAGGGTESMEFWHDFTYAVWDVGSCHGVKTWLCRELWKTGLIQEFQQVISSAESITDLMPAAKKLALQLQAIATPYPFTAGFKRAEKELENLKK